MSALRNPPFGDILERQPERLVVTGFRSCMAGYDYCDAACWETAWQVYVRELGGGGACALMGELQYWVRAVRRHAAKPVAYYPQGCRYLCHDECMALSALAAAQCHDKEAGDLAIRGLTALDDTRRIDDIRSATRIFADALSRGGQLLLPVSSRVVESIARLQAGAKVGKVSIH